MTTETKRFWSTGRIFDLQMFASDEDDDDGIIDMGSNDNDYVGNDDDDADIDDELDTGDDNDKDDDDNRPLDEYGDPIDPEDDDEDNDDNDDQADPEPEKPKQSADENARFAEIRRQQQEQQRLEQEKEAIRQATPEYKAMQMLAARAGMTVEQYTQAIEEAALVEQAKKDRVPVEVLKKQQAQEQETEQLKQTVNTLMFNNWWSQKNAEKSQILTDYPVLTEEDVNGAAVFMLEKMGTTDMPLKDVVKALHSDKIEAHIKEQAWQEALAEISGRKKSPLPPQSGKPTSAASSLSADEKYIAKQMGLSEAEYLKWK